MKRNLRSNRASKETFFKSGQIILCNVNNDHRLYKIIKDWKNDDEFLTVTELIETEKKRRGRQEYQLQENQRIEISINSKWMELEGVRAINEDIGLYEIEQEVVLQAKRALINAEKAKMQQTQQLFDIYESGSAPEKKSQTNRKTKTRQPDPVLESLENVESSSENSSADEESVPLKKQRQSKKKESKPTKKVKRRGRKNNANYPEFVTFSKQLEDQSDMFIDYQSTRMNNKELIRAAMTGNKKLMENIFQTQRKLSRVDDRWGPENDISALEIILKRQDKELLTLYLQKSNGVNLTGDLACQLKEIDTGYNDKYAYGVKTRKVHLGRGNREGNNAFVYDLGSEDGDFYKFKRLLEIETDPKLLELFLIHGKRDNYEHNFQEFISQAIRSGNIRTAQYILKYSMSTNSQNAYGFNYLHLDALGDDFSTYDLTKIKKISITKKTLNIIFTPIHCACINPSEKFLKYFLEETMEYNLQDEIGRKPVHYAAVSQTSACLEFLIQNSADVREGDKMGYTPLMLAAQYGRTHNVKLLLHTNLKAKSKEGNAAIHLASQNGHIECVKLLLENGIKINLAGKNRMTAFHYACAYNHLDLIEFLLDEGGRINCKDKFGRTPLIMAARNGNLVVLSKLLYYGADLQISDSSKNSAIHYAAAYGFLECVEHLIKAGADQNEFNSWKLRPLNVALAKNHFGIVKALIKYENTDVNCVDDDGLTLVAGLIKGFNNRQDQFDFINYLIKEKKADVTLKDKYENTCLSHAMNSSGSEFQIDLIKLLIENGADINVQEKNTGLSPFQQSLQKRNYKLVEMFLQEFNPQINAVTASQRTVIHTLIENQCLFDDEGIKIFYMLLDRIEPQLLNYADSDGYVPLLRLIQVFINGVNQKIELNYQSRVNQLKQKIWDEYVDEYKMRFAENEASDPSKNSNFYYLFTQEIRTRLQQKAQIYQGSYYHYENISATVGITIADQQIFEQQKMEDGRQLQTLLISILKLMLNKGADPNRKIQRQKVLQNFQYVQRSPNEEQNVFHFLFERLPSVSLFQQLLQIFPEEQVDQRDAYGLPLHYFIRVFSPGTKILYRPDETHQDFLDHLFKIGMNFSERNSSNETPTLMIALKYNESYRRLLQQLIQNGGQINDINGSNQIPLHNFVKNQDIKMVKVFINDFKADPNFQDADGRTTLHYAINYSNSNANASFQMEQLLIKFGARCDARDKYDRTPLFYAFTKFADPQNTSEIDPFESVSSLIAFKECDVFVLDRYNRSPLHYAALRGSAISGRYMIKMGLKVDEPDIYNNTPLAYAFFKHSNFSTVLIDNKADVNKMINIISVSDFQHKQYQKYHNQIKDDPQIDVQVESEYANFIKADTSIQVEEVENQEDVQSKLLKIQEKKNQIRSQIISRKCDELVRSDIDIPQLLHNNMQSGQYSYFSQAIRQGWQGLAYLLITDGYEFVNAIEDSIKLNQFQLVLTLFTKVKNEQDVQRVNSYGQNLFHLLAKHSNNVGGDLKLEILEQFELKNISPYLQDQYYKTPLHYSVEIGDDQFVRYFLSNRKCNPNLMDCTFNNPFTRKLQRNQDTFEDFWFNAGLQVDVEFQILNNTKTKIKPFLYLVEHKSIYSIYTLRRFVQYGADINEQNNKGQTALTIAIKNNNQEMVEFLVQQPSFNKAFHYQDKDGKTPIHHVVLPLEFGSYENLNIFNLLIDIFDYNLKDNKGLTPLDYALIFDAQIMKEELLKRNAEHTRSLRQQRMPTSIIATAHWPEQEVDFEDDAQKFQEISNKNIQVQYDNKQIVDSAARQAKADLYVYDDPEYGLFNCLLSKVDIVNRNLHQNVFYKMQLLFDSNRNNYILFTKWGQIGTEGQFQLTPFENLETTMKEYCKIFHQKTGGNDWKQIKTGAIKFEKRPGKYQLISFKSNANFRSLIKPFDLSKTSPYPKCTLDQSIFTVIEQFSQVKLYQQELSRYSFDMEFVPLEKLDRNTIIEAKEYLLELKQLIQDLALYQTSEEIDLNKLQQYYQEINDKSARFYELIPQTQQRQNVLPLLETEADINQKLQLIEILLNVEFSVKILLGANFKLNVMHPITYCFNALNIKMLTLGRDDLEFKMIEMYAQRTNGVYIQNIFAIERKGEAQQFEQHKDGKRYLLWHGSKISNFMSLLAMGLKIAPSWAINTGALYGKGIYFADQFQKSYNYTSDYSVQSNYFGQQTDFKRYRYLLLCEVSASNQVDIYNNEFDISHHFKPDVTLKVVGSQGPNELSQIKMPNGCIVPLGNLVQQKVPEQLRTINPNIGFRTSQTEYIVYDENKVRMRYLIQVK